MKRPAIFILLLCVLSLAAQEEKWDVITTGEKKWELLMQDLEAARKSICLEYYCFAPDASGRLIGDILMNKAQEGIPVRLILENVVGGLTPKYYYDRMAASGVQIRYFTNPDNWPAELNYRDHRKIVVIDESIGYVGGMNLADRYHHDWRDTHLRFVGPAVADLEQVFNATWTELSGCKPAPLVRKVPESPIEIVAGSPFYPVFVKRYIQALEEARDYLYLQTPYLCPPDTLVGAMKAAASRGIDVRILVPKKTDHPSLTAVNRSFFGELIRSGVRVYEYLPRFNHSKVLVADDLHFWVGSVNLDNRSLFLNYEVCAFITDRETAAAQREAFFGLLQESHEVTREEVEAWSPGQRFIYSVPLLIKRQL
ncbi:MAG: hypothetical protein IJ636_03660 [Bacteroidales bacterium]|nr:hypothetical protein [Bacteroidales bacterium]